MKKILEKIYEKRLDKLMDIGMENDCKIIITKTNRDVSIQCEGNKCAFILALEEAEYQILKSIGCDISIFEDIKKCMGRKEIERYE